MKKNKSAFSLVMAMGLVLIMILLVLYILEYIIPYSKNVKGIENSSNAFYQAENSIEEGLLFFKNRTAATKFDDDIKNYGTTKVEYKYNTNSKGGVIPVIGEGDSEFNEDFNIISPGNPIQLDIGNNVINLGATKFNFKVPEIEGTTYTLSGTNIPIINWQLSGETNTLNASGSWILAKDINNNLIDKKIFDGSEKNNKNIKYSDGQDLAGTLSGITDFYTNNCGVGSGCSLKFSIINKLENDSGNISIPYLEYKITTNTNIPLRFSRIKSEGKSYGFQKHLEVKIPQQTTNEAFDFTVFQ